MMSTVTLVKAVEVVTENAKSAGGRQTWVSRSRGNQEVDGAAVMEYFCFCAALGLEQFAVAGVVCGMYSSMNPEAVHTSTGFSVACFDRRANTQTDKPKQTCHQHVDAC